MRLTSDGIVAVVLTLVPVCLAGLDEPVHGLLKAAGQGVGPSHRPGALAAMVHLQPQTMSRQYWLRGRVG